MTVNQIIERIKKARALVKETETKRAELQGRRKQLMERLSKEFRLTTLDEANKRLSSLEEEVADEKERLDDLVCKLDEVIEEMGEA